MVVFHTNSIKLTGEIWEVWINCKGSKERWVKANVDKDLYDDYRDETIKTYTEWLRDQGLLKQIMAYKAYITNNKNTSDGVEINGSSDMPEIEWPSHARKITKHTQDGKQVGRGTLKGLSASAKRLKSSSRKLKVEFSAKLGGPCGDNRRTFVDEVVMTPLIGVRKWKDVKQDVKNSIADCVMNNTTRKLAMTDSGEAGDEGSRSVTFGGQEDDVFQNTYKETTGTKST
uniref:Uncharacterized protein n=1 Tax=Oryza rufipogon TaxID=4529 RepID=A0A0E0R7I6_ORYRU